ncbi:MAG: MlaE family lipid ABC transporter permease subunit [Sideroxyarcus sp.]|nr:MlaE family lipid ABC transporter permease subunit [Sideroxyarcus sp.]
MTADQIAKLVIQTDTASAAKAVKVRCTGAWTVQGIAQLEQQLKDIAWPVAVDLEIDSSAISALDTSGAWLLHRTVRALEQQGRSVRIIGLRAESSSLLNLISACELLPPTAQSNTGLLASIGKQSWRGLENMSGMLAFVGESAIAMMRLIVHPRRIRWRTIFHNMQSAGFEALPIVGLLSFLMGVVIAYQGADQLQRFGANIYIADMVGLAMLRELSPLLTAIIVAGRSGSAYAAQIGTMKVTEEIDALRTIGISPQELLVLPKMIALVIALPLLTVFADVTGILGGMIMARSQLDVSFGVFIDRLGDAVSLSSFLTGIVKAPVFAAIIALVGCYQGFRVGGSADSVGRQTTLSVVQAIFLVILADALFSLVFNWLKI